MSYNAGDVRLDLDLAEKFARLRIKRRTTVMFSALWGGNNKPLPVVYDGAEQPVVSLLSGETRRVSP